MENVHQILIKLEIAYPLLFILLAYRFLLWILDEPKIQNIERIRGDKTL
ncbi:MAG: hypothetical protein Q8T08_11150 [Ignavibacteria bacterium]|nr:hypothetical protein [Ignavibacteria bacterium]